MTDDELDVHITKREVVDAFNRMGQEWNQALGLAHDKIAELTRRLTMAEDTVNYVLSVDARAMSGITKTVFSAVADLKAEVQVLQEKAAKDEQITAEDLAAVEEKAEHVNGAVAGLAQFGPPNTTTGYETPVVSDNRGAGDAPTDTSAGTVTQPIGDSTPDAQAG